MKLPLLFIAALLWSTAFTQVPRATGSEKPFVLGVTRVIPSTILGENRVLNIYLPDGYRQNDSIRYPVIYLLDGSADEDFIHVAGIVQFNTLPWVDRIPASIVVGIANVDRRRDFTFPTTVAEDRERNPTTGHSDKFISFIEKELEPFIDREYQTTASRTIIGQSLGGLLATEILFTHPALFDRYIIISPSLWWDNGSLLKRDPVVLSANYHQPTAVYIGVGKEGLAPTTIPHIMEVEANVLADKLRSGKNKSLQVFFDYLPAENHATITHQAVFNAFRLLYPEKGESK